MRLLLSLVLFFPLALGAQSYRVVKLVEGLDHPWSLAFLPDGRMLVTERPGRLNLLGRDFKRTQIEGVPRVYASGQGGLLEVALHPRFADNGLIYLSYAGPGEAGAGTELARAKLEGNRLVDLRVLFVEEPKTTGGLHFGGRIVFDRAGFLYLTLGERGQMQRAQVPGNHHGSVIRLRDDGTVPPDNPYVGKPGWRPEKYDLGHRNMQGAALHPQTGERFPQWKGNLFVGALRDQMLVRLELNGDKVVKEERLLKGVLGRIRDVRNGPDGYLYLLTDENAGVLARLEP